MDVGSYLLYVADGGGEADLDRFLINVKSCNSLTLTLKYWGEGDNEIAFSNKWLINHKITKNKVLSQ